MLISDWVAVAVGGMNTTNCKMFTNVFHLSYKKWQERGEGETGVNIHLTP